MESYLVTYIAATFGYPCTFGDIPNFETEQQAWKALEEVEHPGAFADSRSLRFSATRGYIRIGFRLQGREAWIAFHKKLEPREQAYWEWEKEHTTDEDMAWRERVGWAGAQGHYRAE